MEKHPISNENTGVHLDPLLTLDQVSFRLLGCRVLVTNHRVLLLKIQGVFRHTVVKRCALPLKDSFTFILEYEFATKSVAPQSLEGLLPHSSQSHTSDGFVRSQDQMRTYKLQGITHIVVAQHLTNLPLSTSGCLIWMTMGNYYYGYIRVCLEDHVLIDQNFNVCSSAPDSKQPKRKAPRRLLAGDAPQLPLKDRESASFPTQLDFG